MSLITSNQNPLIRSILKLEKSRERKKQDLFLIEGLRECRLALEAGYQFQKLLFCPSYIAETALIKELGEHLRPQWTEVTPAVFDALVYRKGIANVLGIAQPRTLTLNDLAPSTQPLILVIDSVEKPGNLGAMLRTCDAAGVSAVIVCDGQTDLYNPNCIRSSLGAVFTQKVVVTSAGECIHWLKEQGIQTYVTYLESAGNYAREDYTRPTAFVVGSEAQGIGEQWLNAGFKHIIIPQFGKVDSMNVANSAAILVYEAVRQRMKDKD